jgi:hypothetical protein
VIAFGVDSLSLDFAPDGWEEVIELVTVRDRDRVGLEACGLGIAQGEVSPVVDAGVRVALSLGPGLLRATRLSRIARAGEVLLEPTLEAVRAGHLLTRGARLGKFGGQRVRGLRLDLRYPRRISGTLARLARPGLRGLSLEQLVLRGGQVLVMLGPRGAGATRLLSELALRGGRAMLRVAPGALGEPLGALRSALRCATDQARPELPARDAASLESLSVGQGLDLDASHHLLESWLGGAGERAVLVDDAAWVDVDTLEVIALASQRSGVAVVASVTELGELPVALAELPRSDECELLPLPLMEGTELVRSLVAGQISENVALRWAKRGGGRPLATIEAVRLGLERGELVWESGGVVPRDRIAGRGRARSADHWLGWRLRLLDPEARSVLDALALSGGEATLGELGPFFSLVGEAVDCSAAGQRLEQESFLERDGDQMRLPGATLRDLLLAHVSRERRASWHRAWFELWGEGERPLGLASAAVHAFCAHESPLARAVAGRAAATALGAGLRATAEALASFADSADTSGLEARGLAHRELWTREEPPPAWPSIVPPQIQFRKTPAPVELVPRSGSALLASRPGDTEAVHRLVAKLRQESVHALAADRLAAMDSLTRGEVGEALRLLRSSKERAQQLGPAERSRAALGLGVGLAAAGRSSEALLEALEGLARAREAQDARGELACARFIAQLAASAGHEPVARAWQALGEG